MELPKIDSVIKKNVIKVNRNLERGQENLIGTILVFSLYRDAILCTQVMEQGKTLKEYVDFFMKRLLFSGLGVGYVKMITFFGSQK